MLSLFCAPSCSTSACLDDPLRVLKHMNGCPSGRWQQAVADALPRVHPVLFLNIGSNKGYSLLEFLNLWSPVRVTGKEWRREIMRYAEINRHGFLKYTPCGNCDDCKRPLPSPHQRRHGFVHAFELAPPTRAVLRHLIRKTNLTQMVTLHEQAVSNSTKPVYIYKTRAGDERSSIASMDASNCSASHDPCMEMVPAVTVDSFLQSESMKSLPVYHVSIDVEGYEPLVLDGMRDTLRQKRVSLLEFEVSDKGFWAPYKRATRYSERRDLGKIIEGLASMGYTCFWQANDKLVPMSGTCWRSEFEVQRSSGWNHWSNVLCAHELPVLQVLRQFTGLE